MAEVVDLTGDTSSDEEVRHVVAEETAPETAPETLEVSHVRDLESLGVSPGASRRFVAEHVRASKRRRVERCFRQPVIWRAPVAPPGTSKLLGPRGAALSSCCATRETVAAAARTQLS